MLTHRLALPFLLLCLIPARAATTETLAPGVYHDTYLLSDPNVVHVIRMDLSHLEYKLQLGLSQKKRDYTAKEGVSVTSSHYEAPGNHVIAAVNGSLGNVAAADKGITGMLVDSAGYVQLPNGIREMICFNDARKLAIEEAATASSPTLVFADGTTMTINKYMADRTTNSLACYMTTWGPTTGTTNQGVEVIVSNVSYPIKPIKQVSGVVTAIRTGAASINNAIPSGGLVLSAQDAAATALLAEVAVGDRVYLQTTIDKPSFYWCNFALSGQAYLLRAGVPVDAGTTKNPYTALAWNATNFFMMTVDGRSTASIGMGFTRLATFLRDTVGATDAICLDGGGSTTMWINGEGVVNVPSDGSERHVPNAVMLVNQPTSSVFPFQDDFTSAGRSLQWDDKFTYSAVSAFSPSAPGGDGYVMTVKNPAGGVDSARVGDLADTNYSVEAQIYCEYRPAIATNGYERCAIFARDNGNQAFTSTTYQGNCYAMIYQTDTGQVQAAKVVNGVITDFLASSPIYLTASAWHKFAIRCAGSTISFLLDTNLVCAANDTTFGGGYCGIGYDSQFSSNDNIHGTRADNFKVVFVGTPPAITSQPQSQVVSVGQNVTFTVAVSGTPPLSYQWQFNGNPLPGGSGSSWLVTAARSVNAGSYSVVVSNDLGSVVSSSATLGVVQNAAWGDNTLGQGTASGISTNLIAIAAGAWHNLGLGADGTVRAWGNDSDGQCDVTAALQDALAIAAGGYHSLALRANGSVVAWGADDYGQADVPVGLTGVIGIAAGTWHSVALRADGTVVVWGDNSFGQTHLPAGLTNVTAVAAGGSHTLALKADGTVVAWGENTDAEGNGVGQSMVPWGLANVVAIGAGKYHSLAVKADGTVVAWGDDSQGQSSVPAGLANVVAVAGGGEHSVALGADGKVTAWGADWNGQCDLPLALAPVAGIAAGEYHTLVLLADSLPVPCLLHPARKANRFSALVQTLSPRNYALEFKDSLLATNWTAVSTNAGNGALRMLTDPAATGAQRFYRMRQW